MATEQKPQAHGGDHRRELSSSPAGRRVSANELRWLAEEADGKREGPDDAPLQIVWRKHNDQWRLGLAPQDDPAIPEADRVANVPVFTPFQGVGLRADVKPSLTYHGVTHELSRVKNGVVEYPDAVFLTQSSFAKFVIPYYARFRTPAALTTMTRKYFSDEAVVAVIHFRPSDEEAVLLSDLDDTTPLTNVHSLRFADGKLSCEEQG